MRLIVHLALLILLKLAYKLLHEVVKGDDSGHSAVLVKHDGEGVAGLFHVAEKHIRLDCLRNEISRLDSRLHDMAAAAVLGPKIILGV